MKEKTVVSGGYFIQCQWCELDGKCALRHHEFMGVQSCGHIDKTPYRNHEDLRWAFSFFQVGHTRSTCDGRVLVTESPYYPLVCECGTVIDGDCQKFQPNEKGKERARIAQEIVKKRHPSLFPELEIDLLTNEEMELLNRLSPIDGEYQTV